MRTLILPRFVFGAMRMRMLVIAWMALASGACSDDASIQLTVNYDDAWALTHLRLTARDKESIIALDREVRITVPNDWLNYPIDLRVTGLRAGSAIASGTATVTPKVDQAVSAEVQLTLLACGEWCVPGATTCIQDGVATCIVQANGCLAWSTTTPCAKGCSLGTCVDTCIDECSADETRCAGPLDVQRCGNFDSDSCLEWGASLACASPQLCSDGACRDTCTSACTPGASKCEGSGVVTCEDRNVDGCWEWSPPTACASGICENGACAAACTDECTTTVCDGNTFRSCGQYDLDPCKDLSRGESCAPADACLVGTCTPNGCSRTPMVCNTPDAATCVDGDTQRTSDRQGSCQAGRCVYTAHETSCPNCPSCDVCLGITCNTPPAPQACYKPTGTCQGGTCNYGYNNAASCDDSNACTTDDKCADGSCRGTPKTCNTPPPAVCANASTLRTYQAAGTCQAGTCEYPSVTTVCASGRCESGACIALAPLVPPSPRNRHVMAYDSRLGSIVLFGGTGASEGARSKNDTWTFDGTAWRQLSPAISPDPRYGSSMIFDSQRNVSVMFGGWTGTQTLDETWEFDGTIWRQLIPSSSPLARTGSQIVFDSQRNVSVVFGGWSGTQALGETWEYNGTTWTQPSSLSLPPPRTGHAMVFDSRRDITILFGGGNVLADTWEYNGTTWTQRTPNVAPAARGRHAMVFDSRRNITVLFGGWNGRSPLADTWEWDTTKWTQHSPTVAPTSRSNHAMAFDSRRNVTVLFGGQSNGTSLNDTWEWDGTTWTERR